MLGCETRPQCKRSIQRSWRYRGIFQWYWISIMRLSGRGERVRYPSMQRCQGMRVQQAMGGLGDWSFCTLQSLHHRLTQISKPLMLFNVIFLGCCFNGILKHGIGDTLSPELYFQSATAWSNFRARVLESDNLPRTGKIRQTCVIFGHCCSSACLQKHVKEDHISWISAQLPMGAQLFS